VVSFEIKSVDRFACPGDSGAKYGSSSNSSDCGALATTLDVEDVIEGAGFKSVVCDTAVSIPGVDNDDRSESMKTGCKGEVCDGVEPEGDNCCVFEISEKKPMALFVFVDT
jgi:hypothetical protein